MHAVTRRSAVRFAACALAVALSAAAHEARAGDAAAAEALFLEGRTLLQQQNYAAACPKLAESHRLDPATGTLLALALCYEGQGKTASAWAAYVEVEERATKEKNAQRAAAAKERATALEPKLPRLVVELAAGADAAAGLTVTRDGALVGAGSIGTPIPVDPGEHTVAAEAPDKVPFTTSVRVGEGDTVRVTVTPLADQSKVDPGAKAPSFFTPARIAGVGIGAIGIVGIGVAGALAGVASSKKAESDEDCDGNVCGPIGLPIRREARSFGDGATAALIAGSVLAAAGVTLVIVGGPRSSPERRAAVTPFVTPGGAGAVWHGSF